MRSLVLLLGCISVLLAFAEDLQSFSATFEQHITDDHNKTILYSGQVWSVRPDRVLWRYEKPVEKYVYIDGRTVTIIEPELEQAIIKKIENDFDFFTIVSRAKPIGDGRYEAEYASQQFIISVKNRVIDTIEYKDPYDNRVTLQFDGQVVNNPIGKERFETNIPSYYDIIKD